MKNVLLKGIFFLISASLVACSHFPFQSTESTSTSSHIQGIKTTSSETVTDTTTASTHHIGQGLMTSDKEKLSHALDKPLGKSTHWTNDSIGTSYTVTPTEKLTINGNPYCRKYQTIVASGDKTREFSGTACVAADGNWESISN